MVEVEQSASGYTIDQLSSASGVPVRTIRFYQGKRALPEPERRGRHAVYRDYHIERLKLIARLQDRGLSLRMIREIVNEEAPGVRSVADWLGVSDEAFKPWTQETARIFSESQFALLVGSRPASFRQALIDARLVVDLGTRPQSYRAESPALLQCVMRAYDIGMPVEDGVDLGRILRKYLKDACAELVAEFSSRARKRLLPSGAGAGVEAYANAIRPIAQEVVLITFAQEVDRIISGDLEGCAYPAE